MKYKNHYLRWCLKFLCILFYIQSNDNNDPVPARPTTQVVRYNFIISKNFIFLNSNKFKFKFKIIIIMNVFEPLSKYVLPIWGGCASYLRQPVVVLQKRVVRTIAGMNVLESSAIAFQNLQVLNFEEPYLLETCIYSCQKVCQ